MRWNIVTMGQCGNGQIDLSNFALSEEAAIPLSQCDHLISISFILYYCYINSVINCNCNMWIQIHVFYITINFFISWNFFCVQFCMWNRGNQIHVSQQSLVINRKNWQYKK